MHILLLIIALITLAGCGQKGPLYLEKGIPDKEFQQQGIPEQADKSEKDVRNSTSRRRESQATSFIASHPAIDQQGNQTCYTA